MKIIDRPFIVNKTSSNDVVSISCGKLILYKNGVEKFELLLNLKQHGVSHTVNGITGVYNAKSCFMDIKGVGKFPIWKLEEFVIAAKEAFSC